LTIDFNNKGERIAAKKISRGLKPNEKHQAQIISKLTEGKTLSTGKIRQIDGKKNIAGT